MEYNFEWDAWSPQYCSVSALGLESRPFWTGGFFRQYGGGGKSLRYGMWGGRGRGGGMPPGPHWPLSQHFVNIFIIWLIIRYKLRSLITKKIITENRQFL